MNQFDVNVKNVDVSICVKCENIDCECMNEECIMSVENSFAPHKLNTVHLIDEEDVPAGLRWKMFAMRLESLSKQSRQADMTLMEMKQRGGYHAADLDDAASIARASRIALRNCCWDRDPLPAVVKAAPSFIQRPFPCDPCTLDLHCRNTPIADVNNEIGKLSNALMGFSDDGRGDGDVSGDPNDGDVVMKSIVTKVKAYNGEKISNQDVANSVAADMWRQRNRECRDRTGRMCDISCKGNESSPRCSVKCFDSSDDNAMVAAAIASARNAKRKNRRLRTKSATETPANIPLDYVREAFDKEPDEEKAFLRWKLNRGYIMI